MELARRDLLVRYATNYRSGGRQGKGKALHLQIFQSAWGTAAAACDRLSISAQNQVASILEGAVQRCGVPASV
jgi:hypothetical protein